ncbi:hypothetical protein B0H19DRAFT_1265686 [Mycena capillaripes]|nr:hypothetical protein B0H19DRAFT_1265686 [Mycena capillaripes]
MVRTILLRRLQLAYLLLYTSDFVEALRTATSILQSRVEDDLAQEKNTFTTGIARVPPPRPPLPAASQRRGLSVPSPQESAAATAAYFNSDAEAEWQAKMAPLTAIVLEWVQGNSVASGGPEEIPRNTTPEPLTENQNAAILADRERQWEGVVRRAMDAMPEPRRREWEIEQREEEQRYSATWQLHARREMGTGVRHDVEASKSSWVDYD